MKLPKITFRAMSFEENMSVMAMFIYHEIIDDEKPNTDFFRNQYTELSNISFSQNMTEEQINELLQSILFDSWNNDMQRSKQKIKDIQSDWNLINDDVMVDLSNKLNIVWPDDTLDIQARVGITYSSPRYINQRTFDTSIYGDSNWIRSVTIHELCHFLYFEKWKELYDDHDESHYNSPDIVWYLSESIIDPLLNNETFTRYTNQENRSNSDMLEIEVNGKSIVETLREIVDSNSIEDAIKKGFDYFKENEEVIKRTQTKK